MLSLAVWGMERLSKLEFRKPGFQVSLSCWCAVWWWATQFPPLDSWCSSLESLSMPHTARLSIKPGDYLLSDSQKCRFHMTYPSLLCCWQVFWFHRNSSLLNTVKFSKGFLVHYEFHFTDWGASGDPKGQGLMALEEWWKDLNLSVPTTSLCLSSTSISN